MQENDSSTTKQWGNWHYSAKTKSAELRHGSQFIYEVDFERFPDASATLDWIMQVSQKRQTRFTNQDVRDLLEMISDIVKPQATQCGGAMQRRQPTETEAVNHLHESLENAQHLFLRMVECEAKLQAKETADFRRGYSQAKILMFRSFYAGSGIPDEWFDQLEKYESAKDLIIVTPASVQ